MIGYAVTRSGGSTSASDTYTRDQLASTKAISGITYKKEPNHTHITTIQKYDASPPIGGDHAQYWADCTGTVYPNPIANENAVHSLEHGAVWLTYKPGLSAADIATLSKLVTGKNETLMSPYPGLKTEVSLQAWGYQLFVDSVTDPRIQQFITELAGNPATQPEPGVTCSNPAFKANPSTPANPTF